MGNTQDSPGKMFDYIHCNIIIKQFNRTEEINKISKKFLSYNLQKDFVYLPHF